MIHYHGTPIGGSRQDVARFLVGRHALVSMARPDDLGAVLEMCQSFILDNGAYSLWKKSGGHVDWEQYRDWVVSLMYHPAFDFAVIPDRIDGSEAENNALIHRWLDEGLGQYGAPVWHLHESLAKLQQLCGAWRVVCIGSSGMWSQPGSSEWWYRMDEAMAVACDIHGRPACRLHGLRMLDPRIFSRLPLASADSTNAAVNQGSLDRFGSYIPATASQRAAVIADRIEHQSSAAQYIRSGVPQNLFN